MIHALLALLLAQPASAASAAPSATDAEAWRLWAAIQPEWQTWASAANTFRRDGADPGPWGAVHSGSERFELVRATDFPNLRHIVHGHMVPVTDPLAQAEQLVEVRLNSVSYDFIRTRGLYTVDGQRRAVAAGEVAFPVGSIQLKAGWRPISDAQRSHYRTMTLRLADGSPRLYGLVALNFAAKTSAGWLWASFEHVDLRDGTGNPGAVSAGTVWNDYRLRGTQTSFLDARGQPVRLGNTALEAGLGQSASCMTCHARAAIGVAGAPERLAVFAPAPTGIRRGYVGAPDPTWFGHTEPQGRWHLDYASLDFVWSLAKAAQHSPGTRSNAGPERRP
jgi:hypothetical protein